MDWKLSLFQMILSASVLAALISGIVALINACKKRQNQWYQYFADKLYALLEKLPNEFQLNHDLDQTQNQLTALYQLTLPLLRKKQLTKLEQSYHGLINGKTEINTFRNDLQNLIIEEIQYWLKTGK